MSSLLAPSPLPVSALCLRLRRVRPPSTIAPQIPVGGPSLPSWFRGPRVARSLIEGEPNDAWPNTRAVDTATAGLFDAQAFAERPVALKEWAVTCRALGSGDQTILLRKGGIRERTFRPKSRQFLLFPTSFHAELDLLKKDVRGRYFEDLSHAQRDGHMLHLQYFACVTGAWATKDPHILAALEDLHIWTDRYVEGRLKWHSNQPLTVLEVRCYSLKQPKALAMKEEFSGCFSWVNLPANTVSMDDVQQGKPAMDAATFQRGQLRLRDRLQGVVMEAVDI